MVPTVRSGPRRWTDSQQLRSCADSQYTQRVLPAPFGCAGRCGPLCRRRRQLSNGCDA
jgi:hypothetical protein